MDNYRLGKYKFNKRMTMIIGAAVIIMAIMIGGGFRQASYTITNPVEALVTITGDLDTADQVIADELLTIHATVDDRLHEKYLQGVFTPVVRLISETGQIAASQNCLVDGYTPAISAVMGVVNLLDGTYTVQIVFDGGNTGEISDEISGIIIDHPTSSGVVATLIISGTNPRSGSVTIEIVDSNTPTYWTSRILVKNSAGTEILSSWADLTSNEHTEIFNTLDYENGAYDIIGEIYDIATDGSQSLLATTTETITTSNEVPPTNELIANIYVKTDSGEYSAWPVVKDGTGVLFGIILVEGIVTGEIPTSVYFVVELNSVEISRIPMSAGATGNYQAEFDTTALADGNYDMLVEANFADGSSLQMSAWGFGVVPGTGGETDMSGFIVFGLAAVVIVTFVYGLKKRQMLYS